MIIEKILMFMCALGAVCGTVVAASDYEREPVVGLAYALLATINLLLLVHIR